MRDLLIMSFGCGLLAVSDPSGEDPGEPLVRELLSSLGLGAVQELLSEGGLYVSMMESGLEPSPAERSILGSEEGARAAGMVRRLGSLAMFRRLQRASGA